MQLTDDQLAATIKACDIHRHSLMRRVAAMKGEAQTTTLAEIDNVAAASALLKDEQRQRLPSAS